MEFLVNHWHCFLPAIALCAALLFMRHRDHVSSREKDEQQDTEEPEDEKSD